MNNTGSNVECEYRNRRPGGHWFDRNSLRFFRSIIGREHPLPDGRWLFVSSELNWRGERCYTVRVMAVDGDIDNIGGFLAYTRNTIRAAFKRAIAAEAPAYAKRTCMCSECAGFCKRHPHAARAIDSALETRP